MARGEAPRVGRGSSCHTVVPDRSHILLARTEPNARNRVFTRDFVGRDDGKQLVVALAMHSLEPDSRTFQIIGAAMEVHRELHRGLAESIYCEALAIEFRLRHIPFRAQWPLQMEYKGERLTGVYRIDFVCFDSVVVEVKGVSGKSLEYKRRVL